jgi:hypothetical protein
LRHALLMGDAIVALAQVELEAHRNFLRSDRIVVLPNGTSAPHASLVREVPILPARCGSCLGRLTKEKGLYELPQGLKIALCGARGDW